MNIRQANIDDLKVVQDFNHELFVHDHEYDSLLNNDWPYSKDGEEYFSKRVSGEEGVCFIALQNGKAVGYVVGEVKKLDSTRPKSVAILENMLVTVSQRHKGVGRSLYDALASWAKSQEAEYIEVNAYFNNADAIRFYESVGFEKLAINLERKL